MATTTEQRNITGVHFPKAFYEIVVAEAEAMSMNFGTAIRNIIRWHRGVGRGRHQEAQPVKAPKPNKKSSSKADKIKKSLLLDDEDLQHIDKMALPLGLTRQAVIVLILADWFGWTAVTPVKSK